MQLRLFKDLSGGLAAGNNCYTCGRRCGVPYLSTDVYIEGEGTLVIGAGCFKRMAKKMGYADKKDHDALVDECNNILADNDILKREAENLRSVVRQIKDIQADA